MTPFLYLATCIVAFALTALSTPLMISVGKKIKAGQPILEYVTQHKGKEGTPTLGGVGFIFSAVVTTLIFCKNGLSEGRLAAIATAVYAVLGFLDDFLKLRRKENGGLTPLQKIIGQTLVALIMGWYCYKRGLTSLYFPFTSYSIDIGYFIIPFATFVFIAMSNAVNLTDGLDCLATSVGGIYFLSFCAICFILTIRNRANEDVLIFALAMTFALLGFTIYNSSPAKIFMGDTGSLALGGACAAVGAFTQNSIISALIGIMFVFSCISVIVQVIVYKLRKRRVFLMAPFHHHLEMKGYSEPRIVAIYSAATAICGLTAIISVYVFQG